MPTSEGTGVMTKLGASGASVAASAADCRIRSIPLTFNRKASGKRRMLDVTRAAAALTREQKENWDRDGYLILPQFFGADVVDPINALIERLSHRGARSEEMAHRVVVDLLAGSAHRRMRLADAAGGAFPAPGKCTSPFLARS